MTPTKITLEVTKTHAQLKVTTTGTLKGFVVIEGTPLSAGGPKPKTMAHLRKAGAKYAKRFNIPYNEEISQ